ncbi:short-chain dehydrogenase [Chromatiales bacterium (ex Bugula neritina AB1)]|nr:short-chain dehydrogenase [Chromatiales bacterium (ex Bugula neritina AB1)]
MLPTILITGAARGIGQATAELFLANNHQVIAVDRRWQDSTLADHPALQRVDFDLQNTDAIEEMVHGLPAIDTLVNNAGILYVPPHDQFPAKQRKEIIAVNLEAPAQLIESVAPAMKSKQSGRIVNIASVAAFTGHPDLWYGITKAGILNMTKAYARFLGKDGILVNAVAPGPTKSEMYDQLPQSRKDSVMASVYSGRVCQPAEVAESIFWLGTSSPAYVNGATIDVNDGSYPR